MIYQFDINSDMGEGQDNDELLMPFIHAVNIACGGHFGDLITMRKTVRLAKKHGLKIGVHPSYPDKENFGRKSMKLNEVLFIQTVQNQIESFIRIVEEEDAALNHIKPHGALYNDLVLSDELSRLFLKAINNYKTDVKLFVPYNSSIEKQAIKNGFSVVYEAFADRHYNDDLSLVSRSEPNAIIADLDIIVERVLRMKTRNEVKTNKGQVQKILAETFCVHSDTKNAPEIAKCLFNLNTLKSRFE